MSAILIEGVTILPVDGKTDIIKSGNIAIRDDRIAYIGSKDQYTEDFAAETIIDGSELLALPGLVNCHTHAAMTLMRGYADDLPLMEWLKDKIWPLEAKLEPEDIYWGTLLCCLEMIKSGTTTFADMYFHMDQAAKAVDKAGMRACLARGLVGIGPEAEIGLVQSEDFVREWHGGAQGRITVMLGPHAPYTCPPDYLRRVAAIAEKHGVGIHIHIAETKQEIKDIHKDYSKSPVGLLEDCGIFELPTIGAHCVHLDEKDIAILAKKNAGVAHNPESNMKLASGVAPVCRLLEAGVKVGIGTDGAASNNNLDMIGEMRSAALLQKLTAMDPVVLPAPRVLKMATSNGADVLGLAKETGSLEVGKKADIILLNIKKPHLYPRHDLAAHIVYAAHSSDVDTVIIDGKVVMENRRVLTIDEDEVYEEITNRAMRLTTTS